MAEHKAMTVSEDPIYQMLAKYKGAIASVLPKHITPERMLRVSYQAIHRTPKLRKCSGASLVNGLIEISTLGLDIGRTAHLVPFKGEAVVITDYKGMIELAHRSGQIDSFPFKPVYENDYFDYEEGTSRYIKHKPATKDRGKLIAAYAIANFKHGGFDFEVVHPVDIEATKKVAPGAKSPDSPWNNPDQEWTMWCKTAVRRLSKRIPQSPELRRITELEDLVEAGLSQNLDHIINGEFSVPPPQKSSEKQTEKDRIHERLNAMKGGESDDGSNSDSDTPPPPSGETEPGEETWNCEEKGAHLMEKQEDGNYKCTVCGEIREVKRQKGPFVGETEEDKLIERIKQCKKTGLLEIEKEYRGKMSTRVQAVFLPKFKRLIGIDYIDWEISPKKPPEAQNGDKNKEKTEQPMSGVICPISELNKPMAQYDCLEICPQGKGYHQECDTYQEKWGNITEAEQEVDEMETLEEAFGEKWLPTLTRVLDIQFHVKYLPDLPEEEKPALIKKLKEELDEMNK